VYQLWLHCVRRHKAITIENMISFAPYMKEKLLLWDKFVDRDGRTTLNMVEYMAMRAEKAKEAEKSKKVKKAKQGKQGKI
jgi:hypothetical protein